MAKSEFTPAQIARAKQWACNHYDGTNPRKTKEDGIEVTTDNGRVFAGWIDDILAMDKVEREERGE